MTIQPVISSKLVAVGYDAISMILRVQLKNATYEYYNVPEHIYKGLMSATSHSHYHATYIRNSYRCTKIA